MGVRPLKSGEQFWYDKIKPCFMCHVAGAFTNPPTATEGAHLPSPRPLQVVTFAGKEIIYLSSEESVGSSNGELSSWPNIFAGVLRDLGIDPEEKKKKPSKKKKVINLEPEVTSKKSGNSRAAAGAGDKGTLHFRQSYLEDYVIISDSIEGLSCIGEKKAKAAGSKSSGSAGSRNPDTGATPSSATHEEEEEEEEEEEPAARLINRKRSREETTAGVSTAPNAGEVPLIGKQSNLCSLYRFSPEAKKKTPEKGVVFKDPQEPAQKRPKVTIKPFKTAGVESEKDKQAAEREKAKAAKEEKKKIAEEEKKKVEEKKKRAAEREEKSSGKPAGDEPKETGTTATTALDASHGPGVFHIAGLDWPHQEKKKEPEVTSFGGSGTHAAGGASSASGGGYIPQVIGPKDTLGDIYYRTYTEGERGNAPHQAPWIPKQKDTFQEFGLCRDWFLNSFTPGELNRQRARTHDGLYQAYVVKEFEKAHAKFDEEKAKFDADKKSEEWGREGLRGKLRAAEEILSKERAEFKKICEKDNQRAYTSLNKITELEGKIVELTGKVEDMQAAKEHAEAELKAQLVGKDKDLAAKDVEIAELKCRMQEQVDRSESLEIDLEAETAKAASAEEAK
ncbi:hypothetical protein Hdeb2414_s0004g00142391 [Helianthus debilis subsp. tardiflorus]